jgi:hypothetical protein
MVCPIDDGDDVPLVLLCAMAVGAPIKTRSTIEMIVVFTLLLPQVHVARVYGSGG